MNLPEILDQGGTSKCGAYAIAGIANFILAKNGSNDRIDEEVLYQETTKSGGDTLGAILAKCSFFGLPLKRGAIVRLKSFKRIIPGALNIKNELAKGLPLAFTYQISKGPDFSKGIKSPEFTLTWPLESHNMVICDFDNERKKFRCANSWGPSWGDGGYFWLEAMRMVVPYCTDVYSFTLSI